jgi:hypothetical protein
MGRKLPNYEQVVWMDQGWVSRVPLEHCLMTTRSGAGSLGRRMLPECLIASTAAQEKVAEKLPEGREDVPTHGYQGTQ